MSPLEALPRVPAQSDLAYERLRTAFINGEFADQPLLNEASLARDLGVSKTPVREALVRLEFEGFIEILPRRGIRVVQLTRTEITEIFDLREALEAQVVRLAVPRLTPEMLAELRARVEQAAERIAAGDQLGFNALDIQFHDLLAEVAGNTRMRTLLRSLRAHVQRIRMSAFRIPGRPGRAHDQHRALLRALEQGRAEEAERIVRHHVASLKTDVLAYLASEARDRL